MTKTLITDNLIKISDTLSKARADMHIFYYFINDERKRFTPRTAIKYKKDDLFAICEIMPFVKNRKDFKGGIVNTNDAQRNNKQKDYEINLKTLSNMKGLNLTLQVKYIKNIYYYQEEGCLEFMIDSIELKYRLRVYKDGFVNITDMAVKPLTVEELLSSKFL